MHNTFVIIILINLLLVTTCFSQNKDSLSFSFDQLKSGDTLRLKSEIRDCGEFGGHNEYIYIYHSKGIRANLIREKPCSKFKLERKYRDKNKPFAQNVELTEEMKIEIQDYITDFLKYADDSLVYCNASSVHSIRFKSRIISFEDNDCSWRKFVPLRDKLFQTAPY